jgi:hypothetical protein
MWTPVIACFDNVAVMRNSIEETLAWMYRKFEDQDVTAETSHAKWLAGEEMDMEHAVWLLSNTRALE